MSVPLYMDVHIPLAITEQLRRRKVDVLTANEDGAATLPVNELLERVRFLGRVIFTHDIRFKTLAEDWQLITLGSEPEDWLNTIEHLPF